MALPAGRTFRAICFLFGVRDPRIALALAEYGFRQEDQDEGWSLVDAMSSGDPSDVDAPEEVALWSWYLRWSRIAQDVITQRALLRRLGLAPLRDEEPAPRAAASAPAN